ncbi:MAG: hypothetical protein AAGG46_08115, partial [Planctomycetota bacterium]
MSETVPGDEATRGPLPSRWAMALKTPIGDLLRGRITGGLHWRVTLSAADLPGAIHQAIEKTVRTAKLWPSERLAVANELIAHFADA